jgi:phi13 family phage major tail protein
MTNKKSFVGVDSIYYALITQDDADAYAAETPSAFAPAMNIKGSPKSNALTQYADNQPFDSMSSEGETELELEVTGLPLDIQAEILGRVYDAATGRMFDNGGTPPELALGFRAKKRGGDYRYYWFLKGTFTSPEEEQATETDTPDPKSTTLKFTAIRTIYQFDLLGDASLMDSVKRVVGETSDSNFSATGWFDAVQSPSAGSPASFTVTPSPADAATGVAVTANITLTFSNPLAGGAENGILLTTAAGVPKACSRTLNGARTIVTLDPTTNLAGTTDYLVIIPNVVSIFGQTLADTVVNFTTT